MAKHKPDVLAEMETFRAEGRMPFWRKLTPENLAKAKEVRKLWKDKKLDHSLRTVHNYFRNGLGAKVGQETLATWLSEPDG